MRQLTEYVNKSLAAAQGQPQYCPTSVAAERATLLTGCYRKGDAEDPEIYSIALISVLSNYPEDVVRLVTDPRTGIAGQSQWLPTIAEVRHACENAMMPRRLAEEREQRLWASRRVLYEVDPEITDRSKRPTFEELRTKYPDLIGHSSAAPRREMTDKDRAEAMANLEARRSALSSPVALSPAARASIGLA